LVNTDIHWLQLPKAQKSESPHASSDCWSALWRTAETQVLKTRFVASVQADGFGSPACATLPSCDGLAPVRLGELKVQNSTPGPPEAACPRPPGSRSRTESFGKPRTRRPASSYGVPRRALPARRRHR